MRVASRIPGKHLAVPVKDKNGRDQLVVIVKYTYRVDAHGRVERDDDGPEPRAVDEPNGEDPATSSIKRPSDLFDSKPGTDVLMVGEAQPRGGASQVDVTLRMGPIAKTVRAHGLRVWQKGVFRISGAVSPSLAAPTGPPKVAWGEAQRNPR